MPAGSSLVSMVLERYVSASEPCHIYTYVYCVILDLKAVGGLTQFSCKSIMEKHMSDRSCSW